MILNAVGGASSGGGNIDEKLAYFVPGSDSMVVMNTPQSKFGAWMPAGTPFFNGYLVANGGGTARIVASGTYQGTSSGAITLKMKINGVDVASQTINNPYNVTTNVTLSADCPIEIFQALDIGFYATTTATYGVNGTWTMNTISVEYSLAKSEELFTFGLA